MKITYTPEANKLQIDDLPILAVGEEQVLPLSAVEERQVLGNAGSRVDFPKWESMPDLQPVLLRLESGLYIRLVDSGNACWYARVDESGLVDLYQLGQADEVLPQAEVTLLKASSPMEWLPGRTSGGVSLETSWKLELEGQQVPPLWWLQHVSWDDFNFAMEELYKAQREARQAPGVTKTKWISPGEVSWDEFWFEPSAEFLALVKKLVTHNQICEQVLAETPIPAHWRRYEFIGRTAEELTVMAKAWWDENSARLSEGPLGLEYWLKLCQNFS